MTDDKFKPSQSEQPLTADELGDRLSLDLYDGSRPNPLEVIRLRVDMDRASEGTRSPLLKRMIDG